MGWTYTYYCKRLGVTFKRGDRFIVKGKGYTNAYDTSGIGYDYSNDPAEKAFYGFYSDPTYPSTVAHPICFMDDYGNPQYYISDDAIYSNVSGTLDKHTVSYNANGGSGAPSSQTKVYGTILTLSSTRPTRPGYTFQGWGTSAGDTTVDYLPGGQYGLDQDITLYAIWKANTYTVYFNAGGGYVSPTSKTVTYALTYGTLPTPTKQGHTFNGWFTSASGGTRITSGSTVSITSDITLYAQWSVNDYVLTVNPNGGTWNGSTASQTFTQKYGTTKEISNPTRVGYDFAGWKLNGYGSFSAQTYTYGAGNGELVAQWNRIVLTVTFDASANGGIPNSTRNVYYGDTIGTLPVPSKPFYKFIGWFTKPVGGTRVSSNNVITSNVTYYAQFKIDASVKVKYNWNNLPAIVWVKVNGAWKKCITWIKDNGKWNKSTGAD